MFPVYEIVVGDADAPEQMGTKPKFWLYLPDLGRCLFKEARPGTGEDWSEKVACELAGALELPHAHYELALCDGKRGTLSRSFRRPQETLVHGNEFLFRTEPQYPEVSGSSRNTYRVTQHTLDLVLGKMEEFEVGVPSDWPAPAEIADAVDVFVGYLVFDAWIGNTDRHHENWAFLWRPRLQDDPGIVLRLAPTFDHASSLGRELTDQERSERLHTRDAGRSVARYVERARSALYNTSDDRRPLTTMDAVLRASRIRTSAAEYWLTRLAKVSNDEVQTVLSKIPEGVASSVAKEFAAKMLELNREKLLAEGR